MKSGAIGLILVCTVLSFVFSGTVLSNVLFASYNTVAYSNGVKMGAVDALMPANW